MATLGTLWRNLKSAAGNVKNPEQARNNITQAYMKGDYSTARQLAVDPAFIASMLLQMGQIDDSTQIFQKLLATKTEPKSAAVANADLAHALLEQQQYDRALQYLRTAQVLWQERGPTDRLTAEVWLRRGANSAEALRLAQRAVEKERGGEGPPSDARNANLREELATLAWAVALESRDAAEVDYLLAEATGLSGDIPACASSKMHLHFGHAFAALGNMAKSVKHYEQAGQVDPNGLSGRAAAELTAMAGTIAMAATI
jgi:tetratricopeptide (TPR) repeat protein